MIDMSEKSEYWAQNEKYSARKAVKLIIDLIFL